MPNWRIEHVTHREKTPVTVITGFLGAGKTTLLNYILKGKGNTNIAVIENEFGEVNIDRDLVVENLVEKENVVTMSNGCMCCSLRKDIVKAFATIERQSRTKAIDAVILETTGLADPAPVAFTFFANPWIASRFRLDSIICVVDVKYLMQHLEDANHLPGTVNEAVQQIAFADLILLNKVDLVDAQQVESVLESIRHINKTARVVNTTLTDEARRPPIDSILGTGLFSVNRALEVDPHFLDSETESDLEADVSDDEADAVQELAPPEQSADSAAGEAQQQQQEQQQAQQGTAPSGQQRDGSSGQQQQQTEEAAQDASEQQRQQQQEEGSAAVAAAAAERAAASAGASTSGAALDSKYGLSKVPRRVGTKQKRADSENCEDNCEECDIVEGVQIKGDRAPRHRAKKMHDLSDVSSVGIMARGELDEYRFNMFMRDLLAEKSKDIFRCKGFLAIHGYGNTKFIFQGVHETICYGPAEHPFRDNEEKANSIVFIGRGLNRKALSEGFRSCVWVPLPEGWEEFRDPETKKPFFANRTSGEKSWVRPDSDSAHVVATQATTEQPRRPVKLARMDSATAQVKPMVGTNQPAPVALQS